MNKAELVEEIAVRTGITKADADRVVSAFTDVVGESLGKGDPVVLSKFGTFVARDRAARKGRNPKTGEEINIGAAKIVGFKPSKALKDAVKDDRK